MIIINNKFIDTSYIAYVQVESIYTHSNTQNVGISFMNSDILEFDMEYEDAQKLLEYIRDYKKARDFGLPVPKDFEVTASKPDDIRIPLSNLGTRNDREE